MRRIRVTHLTATLLSHDALAETCSTFVHNLIVNTALKRLDARAERVFERLDLSATFTALAPKTRKERKSEVLAGVRAYLRREGRRPKTIAAPAPIAKNLEVLGRLLGLEPHELALLLFLVAEQQDSELRDLSETFNTPNLTTRAHVIAAATNQPREAIVAALQPGARLIASGLITRNRERFPGAETQLKQGLADLLLAPDFDAALLLRRYFPADRASGLAGADFAHLGDAPAFVTRLLQAAVAQRRRGVNVLFHGATGTGKTELARLVASECGLELHPAGKSDDQGESASAQERVSSLLLGNRLLADTPALLLFDELEDLFTPEWPSLFGARARAHVSKQWFNELLETNPVPTLWITNSIEGVDPAFLRRFTFAVEFHPLGARQRARALERHLGDARLPDADVRALAERFEVSPAQLGSAVAAARLLEPTPTRAGLERVLQPTERLVRGDAARRHQPFDASAYRLDALNAKQDLVALADSLADWKPGDGPGVSLCLYGPPGTGKSEFAKHLAHRMGRRLLYRRVSDIQSMWVGEAEKNIARAFREAEADDAVLLFDEADSFLRDRRGAAHSWEVTQVNEFLQQLEAFRGVVVCTSNLWSDLDPASLRRFIFKVEFDWLKPAQAAALFATTLGPLLVGGPVDELARAVEPALARIGRLAPGDFAAVARRLRATRQQVTADEAVALLRAEVAAKHDATRAVGFGALEARA